MATPMRGTIFLVVFMLLMPPLRAQVNTAHRGRDWEKALYFTWGYNRAYYNTSNLHLQGPGFDFTLHDAKAVDMPEPWNPSVYLSPTRLTIPQFNLRIGYYFKSNWAISAGWDHMKYRLITTQLVQVSGFIDPEVYDYPDYTGTFNHDYVLYNRGFMDFHHSDGLNFIRLALERRAPVWSSLNGNFELALNGVASVGLMLPWTDFTFFGTHFRNRPHVAGYGLSLGAGIRLECFGAVFLQGHAQSGWTHLGDIMLQENTNARGRQNISFFERSFAFGFYVPLSKRADAPPTSTPSRSGQ